MATLDEIAALAGVSKITVSRVLTGKGKGIRPSAVKRAERIRTIARQLGYRPNVAARAVSTGRFGSVTIITSTVRREAFMPESLLRGIDNVLNEHDMHLSLTRISKNRLMSENQLPKLVREWASDGLLINYMADAPEIATVRQTIERFDIPCVWINTKLETDAVRPDDFRDGRRACEYLLGLGHTRIAYVSFSVSNHYSESDRRCGYEQAMESAGLPRHVLCTPINHYDRPADDVRILTARSLLDSESRPTAVIAYSQAHALPIYEAARDLGLKIPDDLSILSFNPEFLLNVTGIAFTTMATPELAQGEVAVEMLLNKIENNNPPTPSQILPSRLIEGNTCASPNRSKPSAQRNE